MMSARGSSPKMASETVTEPAFLPSRVVTLSSMSRALLRLGRRRILGFRLRRQLRRCGRHGRRGVGQLEFAGLRHAVWQLLLHRIAHRDPAALDAGYRALDQNEPALDVGLHHFEIERGHAIDAHVARHFFVLESLARILTAAGRADRAMRDGHAMARPQAAEVPAFHTAGPALASRDPGDIDILADDEVVGRDLGAHWDQRVVVDAEFGELALGLDFGHREMAAIGSG